MNLSHVEGRLSGYSKEFERQWRNSDQEWRDRRRLEFEKANVDELRMSLKTCMDSMAELTNILDAVIKKCK